MRQYLSGSPGSITVIHPDMILVETPVEGQSKKNSFIESLSNVLVGMFIAFGISQLAHVFQEDIRNYVWSGFSWQIGAGSNALMTVVLTAVSVIRSYIVRRTFNYRNTHGH